MFGGEVLPSFKGTVEWLEITNDQATWTMLSSDSLDFKIKGRLNQVIAPLNLKNLILFAGERKANPFTPTLGFYNLNLESGEVEERGKCITMQNFRVI